MRWVRHKAIITAAAVVVLAGLVTGVLLAVRGGGQAERASATPPDTSQQLRSPFTGEPVPSLNRVLAVKIDNIVNARPQSGLTHADILYVLPVEGGLSRFLAIFSSRYPPAIGPVRSAREDDLQLLRQFGRPAFAYSGATPALLPYIHRTARIVDLYAGTTRAITGTAAGSPPTTCTPAPGSCWRRLTTRARRTASGCGSAHATGREGHPVGVGVLPGRLVPLHLVGGKGALAGGHGRRSCGHHRRGAAGTGHRGDPAHDRARVPVPRVRQAPAVRGEHRIGHRAGAPRWQGVAGTLVRPTANRGTTFTTTSGQPMTFAPGQVWIVLAYPNGPGRTADVVAPQVLVSLTVGVARVAWPGMTLRWRNQG